MFGVSRLVVPLYVEGPSKGCFISEPFCVVFILMEAFMCIFLCK